MCGRTGMSWRRRSTPGSRTGSRGGDDRVCLRRGEGLRSFQGGRETWKTASWQPAGSRIRLPLKESDIPVAVNPKSADGPSNNPQCGFWDSQFSAAQVKSVEQPCQPPQVNGVFDQMQFYFVPGLSPDLPNMGSVLKGLGYKTAYFGKFEMDKKIVNPEPTVNYSKAIQPYGFDVFSAGGDIGSAPWSGFTND